MSQQTINLGAVPSGVGGDTARSAFDKTNANFNEIFSGGSAENSKALNGLTGAADKLPYFTGAGAMSLTVLTAQARTLLAATDQPGQRTALGLGTAATANTVTSPYDTTPSAVMLTQTGGYMGDVPFVSSSVDDSAQRGFSYVTPDRPGVAPRGYGVLYTHGVTSDTTGQEFWEVSVSSATLRRWYRQRYGVGAWGAWVELLSSGNAGALPITGSLAPSTDNSVASGAAGQRWSTVYAGSGTINTSDAREKTAVRSLTEAELAAAQQLAAEIGAYQFLAAVAEKGAEGARQHIGMTVQRAIEILQANNIDPFGYGFICYDQWGAQTVDHPAEYEKVQQADGSYADGALVREAWTEVVREAGDRYSFRMDELLAFIASGQAARLDALESRLAAIGG